MKAGPGLGGTGSQAQGVRNAQVSQGTALQPVDPGVADWGAGLPLPELLQVLVQLPAHTALRDGPSSYD